MASTNPVSDKEQQRAAAREAKLKAKREREELMAEAKKTVARKAAAAGSTEDEASSDTPSILAMRSKQESTADILRRTARTTGETVQIGEHTSQQLRGQGEQLDRIDGKLDEAEYNLKVSDRLVKGMSGFTGKIGSWFTSKPKLPPTAEEKAEAKAKQSKSWLGGWMGGKSSKETPPRPTEDEVRDLRVAAADRSEKEKNAIRPGQLTREEEDLLDMISKDVGVMKKQAVADGHEVNRQRKQLEDLSQKTDGVDAHMKKTTKNIKKLL